MTSLAPYKHDGIEVYIDETSGEVFTTVSGYARMSGKDKSTISKRLAGTNQGVASTPIKKAGILTAGGFQGVALIDENLICEWLPQDNPLAAAKYLKLGIRFFFHSVVGYQQSEINQDVEKVSQDSSDSRVEELESEVYDLKKRLTHLEEYLLNLPRIQIPQFKAIDETFEIKHKESLAMYYEMLETCKTICEKKGKDSLMTSDFMGCSILKRKKFLLKYGKGVKNIKVLNKPQMMTIFLEMQEEGLGTWKDDKFYPNLEKLNTLAKV